MKMPAFFELSKTLQFSDLNKANHAISSANKLCRAQMKSPA
jgi:hypothetical protein